MLAALTRGPPDALERPIELARAQLERRNRSYQPAEHEQLVSGLIHSLDPGFFARLSGAGLDGPRPVFIVGLPRSGTTLIEQILASHPQVHGAGELTLVREDFEAIPGLIDRDGEPPVCLHRRPDPRMPLDDWPTSHDRLLVDLDGGKAARIVDKMPDNYVHLGLIAALFPSATLIYCRRDFRDIAVSCWLTGFRSIRWTNATEHIASRFHQHVRMMNHWQSVLPGRIHQCSTTKKPWPTSRARRRGWWRLAAWSGIRHASSSTARPGPSGPRVSLRCVSRFIRARSPAGRTTKMSLRDLFAALPAHRPGPGRSEEIHPFRISPVKIGCLGKLVGFRGHDDASDWSNGS